MQETYLLPVYLQTAGFSRDVPFRLMYSTGQPSAGFSPAWHTQGHWGMAVANSKGLMQTADILKEDNQTTLTAIGRHHCAMHLNGLSLKAILHGGLFVSNLPRGIVLQQKD